MSTSPVSMAQLQNAQQPPLSPAEQNRLTLPSDPWSNGRALAIAMGDFWEMSNYRQSSGHNVRLQIAEELYLGWCGKKYFEGTRIPRSSLGVPISMDQVEALMPTLMSSIFPLRDNVDCSPNPGTTKLEADTTFDVLMSQLDQANIREKARKAIKDGLVFGNGILEICWKYEKVKRPRTVVRWVPETRQVFDPTTYQSYQVQTGRNKRVVETVMVDVEINRPDFSNVPIHDFYIDPNCQSNDVQDARFASVRQYMTIGEIMLLPNSYGFSIPAKNVLIAMAKGKPAHADDSQKAMGEAYRLGSWMPQNDYSADPNNWRVEVIRYYSKDRCVWIINRAWVLYNAPNTYGFIPFLNAFYVDVPNRFFGFAVTDMVEGEQRFQQATINAYIDELNLSINAPFAATRGAEISGTSMRMYPGKVIKMEKKDDLTKLEFGNSATQTAMAAIAASDNRAQKRTGITDTAVMGVGTAGGDSSNRTATGVGVKANAAGGRIRYQVENLESNFIEPMLKMMVTLNQIFLNPLQVMQIMGPDGQAMQIDPTNVINADVKFKIRGSNKMQSRMMLLQGLPLLTQTYLNPEFLQFMSMVGKAPDMKQWDRMISDAYQLAPMSLWMDMNPDQMQMMQQMKMGPQILAAQTQQRKLDAQTAQHDSKDQTQLLTTLINKLPDEAMHEFLGTTPAKQLPAKGNGSTT